MNKNIIFLLVLLSILSSVVAVDRLCEDVIGHGQSCTMLTPTLICSSYNYTIFNQTSLVLEGNLTVVNDSIYYFTFNQTSGDYIIKLCDDSTREIYVKGDENTMIAIILFISILTIVFGAATFKFDGELRFFFLLLCAIFGLIGLNLIANMAIGESYQSLLWNIYRVSLYVFMFMVFYVIVKIFMLLRLRRNEINTKSFSKMNKMK